MLGCSEYCPIRGRPGDNAMRLARIICATVLAGELSLLASQCTEGDLVLSHMRLNRSVLISPPKAEEKEGNGIVKTVKSC